MVLAYQWKALVPSSKHQVDVVSGERQRFVVVIFKTLSRIPVSICLLCQHQSVLMMTCSQSWEKKVKH